MIYEGIKQGSDEWHSTLAGIPSGSNIGRLLTPAKEQYSVAGARTYMHELLAEWLCGHRGGDIKAPWMDRGREYEGDALFWYTEARGAWEDLKPGGVMFTDDRSFCGSPDCLVGDPSKGPVEGGVEIKIPHAREVVAHALGDMKAFRAQCQAYMWIADVEWWDLLIWNPMIRPVLKRIERDDEYIGKMLDALARFMESLEEHREILIERGWSPRERKAA